MKSRKKVLWEYIEAIVTALILALFIRAFVVQAFKIPTGSMIPTLLVGDHILANKFLLGTPVDVPFTNKNLFRMPGLRKPRKGDIIIFKFPEDPSRDFIKRVIAVEGDLVESKNKVIYVNGKPVTEPFVQHTDSSMQPVGIGPRDNFGPYIVPKEKYFVMGDNRDQSHDSRYWGYVDIKDIKGKAFILYWSWDSKDKWVRFNRIGGLVK